MLEPPDISLPADYHNVGTDFYRNASRRRGVDWNLRRPQVGYFVLA